MKKTPRAILFDLDGTLIHSAPDLHAAANAICIMRGWRTFDLETITSFIGNGIPVLVKRIFEARGASAQEADYQTGVMDFLEYYNNNSTKFTRPYDGVIEMLDALHAQGIAMGIVTNKPREPAVAILKALGLDDYFATVIGGDSTPAKKPDTAPYLAACTHLGVNATDTVYVGDSETDAKTAVAVDVPFILFTGGYRSSSLQDMPHTSTIDEFSQLAALVDQMLKPDHII